MKRMAGPKHNVETVQAQDIARPAFDLLTPLSSRVLFWQPRFVLGSDAVHSLPYLFWLVETLRPARMVQIGIGDGVSYLGLCQAVDKLGLDTMCLGLDWPMRDKPVAGGFAEHHASHYSDVSRVLSEDPATAFRHLRSGGIDLLVVQAPLDAGLAETLRAHWHPLLSEQAVLVFLGADLNSPDPQVREFLAAFLTRCPVVELEIEAGTTLTVLLGADQPERLSRLAALEMGRPGYAEARQVFARLGTGLRQEQLAKFRTLELKKIKATLSETEARIAERDQAVSSATAEAKAALEAEAETAALMASLQARIFDLETTLQDQAAAHALSLETARAEAAAALQESEEKRKAHWRNLTAQAEARSKAEARITELTQKAAQLAQALDAETTRAKAADARARTAQEGLIADIAALTRHFEAEQASILATLTAEQAKLSAQTIHVRTLTSELEAFQSAHKTALAEAATERENRAAAQDQLAARDGALRRLQQRLDVAQDKRTQHWHKLEAETARRVALEASLAEAEARIIALEGSTSWKVTKPLRKIRGIVPKS